MDTHTKTGRYIRELCTTAVLPSHRVCVCVSVAIRNLARLRGCWNVPCQPNDVINHPQCPLVNVSAPVDSRSKTTTLALPVVSSQKHQPRLTINTWPVQSFYPKLFFSLSYRIFIDSGISICSLIFSTYLMTPYLKKQWTRAQCNRQEVEVSLQEVVSKYGLEDLVHCSSLIFTSVNRKD